MLHLINFFIAILTLLALFVGWLAIQFAIYYFSGEYHKDNPPEYSEYYGSSSTTSYRATEQRDETNSAQYELLEQRSGSTYWSHVTYSADEYFAEQKGIRMSERHPENRYKVVKKVNGRNAGAIWFS